MLKQVFQTLVVLSFASSAFAQSGRSAMKQENAEAPRDQFSSYVMKGFSAGLEYSSMMGDLQIKAKDPSTGTEFKVSGNTNEGAGALGVSVNYANLPRARAGYMVGLGVINKVENDSNGKNTLKSSKGFSQIRPEGNVGYALSNGLWGMVGAHASLLTGGNITDFAAPLGGGLQASVGYVPVRNLGFDIGYYITMHTLSDSGVKSIEESGLSVDKSESWMKISQLRARAMYYF
ncbi:hypothetical protein [Bdellovibrio svalbardensis]|uniref:Outer membrane protein beta-barrel domain-containing protein n=1 Tax=Bdellovibrio svalbardensis TaxID=2972972 RepID=A0ABT6DFC3_9BACT|nr:hypothetical protein [Bdellovibrio svalbardensis]MDG0815542.1 hypothetical protein [Bdellovibrio svalbardensis]